MTDRPDQDRDARVRRLLIVEDDPGTALCVYETLAHAGVKIDIAQNGIEAVAQARTLRPHVILLDVWLPGMDGFEVFRTIRREPDLRDCRVIFLSAHASDGAMALAKDNGAYAWLKKPFSPPTLRRKVFEALELDVDPAAPAPPAPETKSVAELRARAFGAAPAAPATRGASQPRPDPKR